jgi:peptidoglycan hydrolase-like protein with peptidoglycan-binding domain
MPRLNEEAETAEKGLSLEPADRRRLQVALTSLGFDTRGDDGVLGPRSREMIAHWQKARNQAATGFMTRAQQQALLKEAAAALSGYDEQRKADEELKGRTTAEAPVAAAGPPTGSADGLWRGTYECVRNGSFFPFTLKPEIHLKGGAGTWYTTNPSWTNNQTTGISVSIDGTNVLVTRRSGASASTTPLSGRLEGTPSGRATTFVQWCWCGSRRHQSWPTDHHSIRRDTRCLRRMGCGADRKCEHSVQGPGFWDAVRHRPQPAPDEWFSDMATQGQAG